MKSSIRYICFSLLAIFSTSGILAEQITMFGQVHINEDEDELQYVNKQIESLTNLKNYYGAKSVRFRNRASRLQFQQNLQTEARRLTAQADEYDKIVEKLNAEINRLEQQRDALDGKLNEH